MKSGSLSVQISFIVINKSFDDTGVVIFKNIEWLFVRLNLGLKYIGLLHISARVFGGGISLSLSFDEELHKVL